METSNLTAKIIILDNYMASTKNQLQQFLQKLKLDLPEYFSSKTDEGLWISTVKFVLSGDEIEELEYTGEPFKRKTHAECSAAFKAIQQLECIKKNEMSYAVDNVEYSINGIYVLVDYENINKISNLEKLVTLNDKVTLLKFAGHCHPKALAGQSNYVIESSIKDAIDHYISFYIGKLVHNHQFSASEYNNKLLILVLTRDHYASAYQSFTNDSTVDIIHCASEMKCMEYLS